MIYTTINRYIVVKYGWSLSENDISLITYSYNAARMVLHDCVMHCLVVFYRDLNQDIYLIHKCIKSSIIKECSSFKEEIIYYMHTHYEFMV